jgi:FKBP-type peptidyl-prolyl cis-trans isomerase FkpA
MKPMRPLALFLVCASLLLSWGCVANQQLATKAVDLVPGPVDADAPTEFTETASGLRYKVLRKSDGPKPTQTDTVTVNYKGTLDSGKVFDSSYDRGEPISFSLMQVVAGWTEGLQLVGEGGMIELDVPPKLGYGAQGAPGAIPPNARLHFTVELLKVN